MTWDGGAGLRHDGHMDELAWLIFRPMRRAKRIRRLRLARAFYERQLADAEASVVEARAALDLIDGAIADCQWMTGDRFL